MSTHRVKSQILEVTLPDEGKAQQLYADITRIQRERIVPLLQRHFDQFSDDGQIHRIEKLELDLGFIDEENFEALFLEKLNKVLPKVLHEQGRVMAVQLNPSLSGNESADVKTQSQLELFDIFAKTGCLPWWADVSDEAVLDNCLALLLQNSPALLRRMMGELAKVNNAIARIINHYDDGNLEALTRFLSPQMRHCDQLMLSVYESALIKLHSKREVRSLAWKGFFDIVLSASFSSETFSSQFTAVLLRLTRHCNIEYPAFIEQLINSDRLATPIKELLNQELQHIEELRLAKVKYAEENTRAIKIILSGETLAVDKKHAQEPSNNAEHNANRSKASINVNHENDTVQNSANKLSGSLPTAVGSVERSAENHLEEAISGDDRVSENVLAKSVTTESPQPDNKAVLLSAEAAKSDQQKNPLKTRHAEPIKGTLATAAMPTSQGTFSESDEVFVSNAGLVILGRFLTPFFNQLGLIDAGHFKSEKHQFRAVGLLQYIATGHASSAEYLLPLNKILCGLSPDALYEFGEEISDNEIQECDVLLRAVIEHASVLNSMSNEGFIGSFLMRQGVLRCSLDIWLLQVERETYDIVLDQFPWSFNYVREPWMRAPLQIEW
ncbi:MAG: hypothetical protein HRU20_13015 [Pseudomonadales bacterium]|nr:hypothetical protein [Pseudomonadales bacterium]